MGRAASILGLIKYNLSNKKACKIIFYRLLIFCDPGGVRTPNPQSRNLIFYPVELRGQKSRISEKQNRVDFIFH